MSVGLRTLPPFRVTAPKTCRVRYMTWTLAPTPLPISLVSPVFSMRVMSYLAACWRHRHVEDTTTTRTHARSAMMASTCTLTPEHMSVFRCTANAMLMPHGLLLANSSCNLMLSIHMLPQHSVRHACIEMVCARPSG